MLGGILLVGLLLRSYELPARSLWFDEAFSWRLTQFPFLEMVERVGHDNHPPLYFILLKTWATLFGASAVALRALSVLLGCLTVLGVYVFATEAFADEPRGAQDNPGGLPRARGTGLLAAALVALSGFQIRYSWEVRMYTLAAALAVFSSWALCRALRPPSRLRRWLVYSVLAVLLAYTHYYGLFTLAAQAVFVTGFLLVRAGWRPAAVLREPAFRHAVLAAGLVTMAWLPWLPTFLQQRGQVKAAFWSHPVTFWDVGELCYQMFVFPEYLPPPSHQAMLWAVDLCLVGVYLLWRRAGTGDWFVLCLGVGPLVFCLLASLFDISALTLRYYLMAHVFLLVGLAALVWRFRFPPERVIAALGLLAFFVGTDVDAWRTMDLANRPGARGAGEFLAQERRPGEPVLVCMPFFFFPLLYYAPDRSGYCLYTDGRPMPNYYGTAALTPEDLITDDGLQALRSRRVWVVNMDGGFLGIHTVPVPSQWVETGNRRFSDVFQLGNLMIVEYDTTGNPAHASKPAGLREH
jgi:hypothetical protein